MKTGMKTGVDEADAVRLAAVDLLRTDVCVTPHPMSDCDVFEKR